MAKEPIPRCQAKITSGAQCLRVAKQTGENEYSKFCEYKHLTVANPLVFPNAEATTIAYCGVAKHDKTVCKNSIYMDGACFQHAVPVINKKPLEMDLEDSDTDDEEKSVPYNPPAKKRKVDTTSVPDDIKNLSIAELIRNTEKLKKIMEILKE